MSLKWWNSQFSSLVIGTLSTRQHSCVMYPSRQALCRRQGSSSRTVGQFLYSLEDMPFNPVALQAQTLRINVRASSRRSPPDLKGISGSPNDVMPSIGGNRTSPRGLDMFCEVSFKIFLRISRRPPTFGCCEELLNKSIWIPVERFPAFTLLFPSLPVVFCSGED